MIQENGVCGNLEAGVVDDAHPPLRIRTLMIWLNILVCLGFYYYFALLVKIFCKANTSNLQPRYVPALDATYCFCFAHVLYFHLNILVPEKNLLHPFRSFSYNTTDYTCLVKS